MSSLLTTIVHRPYVFIFLAAYLFLAWRLWGWRRTILWLVSGYAIAWLSEYSSIHNGFPYGEYHYVYENLKGELLIAGVPFFDSLSYPFLIFAGYTTAKFIMTGFPLTACGNDNKKNWSAVLLGALLTMFLDVIIDPIATMGDKWFLGNIHWYAYPGWYFGVPMSNFAGWFLVSFTVIAFNVLCWRSFPSFFNKSRSLYTVHCTLFTALFYCSIALFNIAITFWVGEWKLGVASSFILVAVGTSLLRSWTSRDPG